MSGQIKNLTGNLFSCYYINIIEMLLWETSTFNKATWFIYIYLKKEKYIERKVHNAASTWRSEMQLFISMG